MTADADPRYQRTLEATVSEDDFSAEGIMRQMAKGDEAGTVSVGTQDVGRTVVDPPGTTPSGASDEVMPSFDHKEIPDPQEGEGKTDSGSARPRYEVTDKLGGGGMGQVFTVRDLNLQREIAVKVLHSLDTPQAHRRTRFVHEARVTANLEHSNILPVHDLGLTTSGDPYFMMRKVNGTPLGDVIRHAVKGMLPKNRLGRQLFKKLKVYAGAAHPHEAQKPQILNI